MLAQQKTTGEKSKLVRVSMVGVGLERDVAVMSRLATILKGMQITPIEMKQSAIAVDVLLNSSDVQNEKELLQALHKEFIQ